MKFGVNRARAPSDTRRSAEDRNSVVNGRFSRRQVVATLAAAGLPVAGCTEAVGSGRRTGTSPIVIASGATEGVYYRYGAALAAELHAEIPGRTVGNVSTSGSVDNLRRLVSRQATVGFTAADAAADAYAGIAPFTSPAPLRAIASLYDDYLHLVVRADSAIQDIGDLRGRRVSCGPPGSGTALLATRLLALAGLPPTAMTGVPLGINESASALRTRQIEAFFWSGGLPTQGIAELATQTPVRLVSLEGLSSAMRSTYGIAYRSATIQPGSYPGVPAVTTLAVPDILVTTDTADDQTISDLTRLLFTARDRLARRVPEAAQLDPRSAIYTGPIPLHPAAARYYRTAKP